MNYRYLEDELVYLLDNSDAEVLLFHGSLGDHVAKVRDRAPKVKLWVQVDDGSPHQEFAQAYEDLIAKHEPMERIERSGDDLYFLYTGGTTGMPKGVMWRNEDLFGVLGDGGYPLAGLARPDTMAEVGPIAKAQVDAGANRVQLPASPLMHGTGAFTTFQSLFLGASIVTLVGRQLRPARAVADGAARARSRRWRLSATRSPNRCCVRSNRPRSKERPTTSRRCRSSSARA